MAARHLHGLQRTTEAAASRRTVGRSFAGLVDPRQPVRAARPSGEPNSVGTPGEHGTQVAVGVDRRLAGDEGVEVDARRYTSARSSGLVAAGAPRATWAIVRATPLEDRAEPSTAAMPKSPSGLHEGPDERFSGGSRCRVPGGVGRTEGAGLTPAHCVPGQGTVGERSPRSPASRGSIARVTVSVMPESCSAATLGDARTGCPARHSRSAPAGVVVRPRRRGTLRADPPGGPGGRSRPCKPPRAMRCRSLAALDLLAGRSRPLPRSRAAPVTSRRRPTNLQGPGAGQAEETGRGRPVAWRRHVVGGERRCSRLRGGGSPW